MTTPNRHGKGIKLTHKFDAIYQIEVNWEMMQEMKCAQFIMRQNGTNTV